MKKDLKYIMGENMINNCNAVIFDLDGTLWMPEIVNELERFKDKVRASCV